MHELFELTEVLPMAPGESPFHVRGFYYTRFMEHAKSLPGGKDALLAAVTDERVREFLSQKFAWQKWYDALPTLPCHIALARVRNEDFETLTRARARLASKVVIPSMFRTVLAITTASAMARHVPSLMMANFDFMRSGVADIGEGVGQGQTHGMPLLLAPSLSNTILGFIEGAMELAKYRDVSARYTDVVPDGEVDGFPTVTVSWQFRWSPRR